MNGLIKVAVQTVYTIRFLKCNEVILEIKLMLTFCVFCLFCVLHLSDCVFKAVIVKELQRNKERTCSQECHYACHVRT